MPHDSAFRGCRQRAQAGRAPGCGSIHCQALTILTCGLLFVLVHTTVLNISLCMWFMIRSSPIAWIRPDGQWPEGSLVYLTKHSPDTQDSDPREAFTIVCVVIVCLVFAQTILLVISTTVAVLHEAASSIDPQLPARDTIVSAFDTSLARCHRAHFSTQSSYSRHRGGICRATGPLAASNGTCSVQCRSICCRSQVWGPFVSAINDGGSISSVLP